MAASFGGDNVPQWKKELIQRRKNVAKTFGGNNLHDLQLPKGTGSSLISNSTMPGNFFIFVVNTNY